MSKTFDFKYLVPIFVEGRQMAPANPRPDIWRPTFGAPDNWHPGHFAPGHLAVGIIGALESWRSGTIGAQTFGAPDVWRSKKSG